MELKRRVLLGQNEYYIVFDLSYKKSIINKPKLCLNNKHTYWDSGNVSKLIEKIEDKDFPHIYDKNVEMKKVQIYLYMNSVFNSSKYLSNTIIPWAIEWLYYYELWLTTGKWLGGGRHPENCSKKKKR